MSAIFDVLQLHHDREVDVSMAVCSYFHFLVELLRSDNGPCGCDVHPHILRVEYILGCRVVQMDSPAWLEMVDIRTLFLRGDPLEWVQSKFTRFV